MQRPSCPACGDRCGRIRDRKWFHTLIECQNCMLLYRFPMEPPQDISDFYNVGYAEPGLTTELPNDNQLSELLDVNFKGSEKDFTRHISIFSALKVPTNAKILDFGANWGYASWQFARAEFDVKSFEISHRRAAYGEKLGLTIHTNIHEVGRDFDVVYSCHVLEHIPNARGVLLNQLSLLKPGGLVVAHTPNGSNDFQLNNYSIFHRIWGRVHPVLLTDRFVQNVAGSLPYICTSDDRPENLANWDRVSQIKQPTNEVGLFFAIQADG